MKVWIVFENDYDGYMLLGIFTNKRAAEDSRDYYNRPMPNSDYVDGIETKSAVLEEIETDVRMGHKTDWREKIDVRAED